jgi:putative SOS response-associated peptidase YedK
MCGRFSLDRSADIIEARFKAKLRIQTAVLPLYNIGPGMETIGIGMDDPEGISLYTWGLAEHSRDGKSRNLINARCETFHQKWPFKSLIKKNRCLIPATGYIEWKAVNKMKIPYLIHPADRSLFVFAGLFEEHAQMRRFTILTRPSGPVSGRIHDRMPVILPPGSEASWLNPDEDPEEMGRQFLSLQEGSLATESISREINGSFANNPDFLKPKTYAVPEQLKLF